MRFAETSGFGANNFQATRKNLQITSDQGLRSVRSCNSWTLEVALSGQRSGDMTGAWPRGGLAARQSGWIHIRIGHRSCKKWFHITIQSYCWALHFIILLLISQRHLMLETLSIPSCTERAMTFQDWDLEGVSFAGPQCWWAQALPAHLAVAHRGRGKNNFLLLQVESYALQPVFMDSQTFGCQDAWFQEQTDTVSSGTICVWYTSVGKGSSTQNPSPFPCRLLCHVPFKWPSSSAGGSYRESLATVSQWGNGTLLTPFGLKSGKQWKTGKEWDRWMMIDDGSRVACTLQTISEETRGTRCWGDQVRADLCSFVLEERWIFFIFLHGLNLICLQLAWNLFSN